PRGVTAEAPDRRLQEPELTQLPLRPSNLPLQTETRRSRDAPGSYRYHGETTTKLGRVVPLGETEPQLPPSFSFTCSPEKPAKCKPVGIAQGVPQHPHGCADAAQSPEHC
ncbi:hypothetical protein N332_07531, partial [Mesitornis unicolor]